MVEEINLFRRFCLASHCLTEEIVGLEALNHTCCGVKGSLVCLGDPDCLPFESLLLLLKVLLLLLLLLQKAKVVLEDPLEDSELPIFELPILEPLQHGPQITLLTLLQSGVLMQNLLEVPGAAFDR